MWFRQNLTPARHVCSSVRLSKQQRFLSTSGVPKNFQTTCACACQIVLPSSIQKICFHRYKINCLEVYDYVSRTASTLSKHQPTHFMALRRFKIAIVEYMTESGERELSKTLSRSEMLRGVNCRKHQMRSRNITRGISDRSV